MHITSKLSSSQTSIFSEMSALASQHNAINLGQGFPNFDPSELLLELVKKYIGAHKNQYAPMAGVEILREILSDKILNSYHQYVDPTKEITITAGATQAIFTAIQAFIKQGDEVIIFEPAYDSYRPTIELAGGKTIAISMNAPDFVINWNLVAANVNLRTKMIIINSPHNPTGTIMSHDDFQSLAQIVKSHDIIVLSDEVYEHLVYDGRQHLSVLMYPELWIKCLAIFSFGKTFHCTGWKMGYCVGPEYLMKEFRNVHQWNVFSANSFLQHALAEYLECPDHYLKLPDFYQQKRDGFLALLSKTKFRPLACKGTFFQLVDYSEVSDLDDVEFAVWLTREHKVTGIPVSVFSQRSVNDKLIRFCFAKTDMILKMAGENLQKL